jgi:uncharacterized protein YdcH (DUF465 family)
MMERPQDLKGHLVATNEQFRKLADQHHNYDEQLRQLSSKVYLNDEEQLEEVKLKKLKLRLKDEMQRIMQQHKKEHPTMA